MYKFIIKNLSLFVSPHPALLLSDAYNVMFSKLFPSFPNCRIILTVT